MAAGHASRKKRDQLLSGLLHKASSKRGSERDHLRLLAAATLETSPELDGSLRTRIEEGIASLLPPRTPDAVRALSRGGDFVLDLLAQTRPATESEIAHTVEAAARIGSESAIPLIARFRTDERLSIKSAILEAWPRFNPDDYASEVLSEIDFHNGYIHIGDASLLPAARHLSPPRKLLCDFSGFVGVPEGTGLNGLAIADPAFADLACMAELSTLEELLLLFTRVQDLAPLAALPNLRYLGIASKYRLDLTPLCGREGLTIELASPMAAFGVAKLHPSATFRRVDEVIMSIVGFNRPVRVAGVRTFVRTGSVYDEDDVT